MSRVIVQVVLRDRISTSPELRAVKRCFAESGEYLTFSASPKTAAATARQRSTSRPVHLPLSSAFEKPGRPCETPHWTNPFALTASSVVAALADATAPNPIAAPQMADKIENFFIVSPLKLVLCLFIVD